MSEQFPHPEALGNFEWARISESKIRNYAIQDRDKRRPFRALGFSEGAGKWKALHDAILDALPYFPAVFAKQNEHGITHEVILLISGPSGKEAPVKTYWIYAWGDETPRLTTLFINVREWSRMNQQKENDTGAKSEDPTT